MLDSNIYFIKLRKSLNREYSLTIQLLECGLIHLLFISFAQSKVCKNKFDTTSLPNEATIKKNFFSFSDDGSISFPECMSVL